MKETSYWNLRTHFLQCCKDMLNFGNSEVKYLITDIQATWIYSDFTAVELSEMCNESLLQPLFFKLT